jgi:hypothetical protein
MSFYTVLQMQFTLRQAAPVFVRDIVRGLMYMPVEGATPANEEEDLCVAVLRAERSLNRPDSLSDHQLFSEERWTGLCGNNGFDLIMKRHSGLYDGYKLEYTDNQDGSATVDIASYVNRTGTCPELFASFVIPWLKAGERAVFTRHDEDRMWNDPLVIYGRNMVDTPDVNNVHIRPTR